MSKNSPQPRVRASHPGKAKPSAIFPCSYLPNACLWCVFITYPFTPFLSQLLILYSHLSTNTMGGGGGGGGAVLVWLRTVTSGRVCYTRQSTVGVHKVLDTLGPAENLSAFQERLCSMELVSSFSHSSPGTEGSFIVKSYKEPK